MTTGPAARKGTFAMKKKATGFAALLMALVLAAPGQTIDFSKKPVRPERSRTYDALHYLIKLKLDIDRKAFEGETTVTLAQGFPSGKHRLEISGSPLVPIAAIRAYRPPLLPNAGMNK